MAVLKLRNQIKLIFAASIKKKKNLHTKKEKDFLHFLPASRQQSTKFYSPRSSTERKHQRTSSAISHTYSWCFLPLIVVFAAARTEEAENAKRNAFERNFFVFQFCFGFGTVKSWFLLVSNENLHIRKSRVKRKDSKDIFVHDKSSSYWIIEIERKLFARCKNKRR